MTERMCECGCGEVIPEKPWHVHRPTRFIAGHQARSWSLTPEVRDCGYDTPCHVWTGFLNHNGYSRTSYNQAGHRAAWEKHHGRKIPADLTIDHLCRNRACVNPEHLEAVTHQENVRRGLAAKQAGTGNELRVLRHQARLSQVQLARLMDVTQPTVSQWEIAASPPDHALTFVRGLL